MFTLKSSDICVTISKGTGGICLQEGRGLLQTSRSDNGFLDFVVSAKLVESRQINAQIRYVCSSVIYHSLLVSHINTQKERKERIKFSYSSFAWFKYITLWLSGTRERTGLGEMWEDLEERVSGSSGNRVKKPEQENWRAGAYHLFYGKVNKVIISGDDKVCCTATQIKTVKWGNVTLSQVYGAQLMKWIKEAQGHLQGKVSPRVGGYLISVKAIKWPDTAMLRFSPQVALDSIKEITPWHAHVWPEVCISSNVHCFSFSFYFLKPSTEDEL